MFFCKTCKIIAYDCRQKHHMHHKISIMNIGSNDLDMEKRRKGADVLMNKDHEISLLDLTAEQLVQLREYLPEKMLMTIARWY